MSRTTEALIIAVIGSASAVLTYRTACRLLDRLILPPG